MVEQDPTCDGFVERLERALRASGASEPEIAAILRHLREQADEPSAQLKVWRYGAAEGNEKRRRA